jgi:hypothetical protein
MRPLHLLSLAAAALALPAERYEDIIVRGLYINMRPENNTVVAVSFSLTGHNATDLVCGATDPGLPSPVITCGDSKYRFALYGGAQTQYALRLYHELGTG